MTPITRQMLNHWNHPERERWLFFRQWEAAEILIWLVEASPAEKQGISIPKVNGLVCYACKMATGSGKTVVMGMVIAWQVLNKLANSQDKRFSDAVLLVCPNLTIKERLRVFLPTSEVLSRTVRPCVGTTKSHISHVVLDAPKWEPSVAYQLDRIPEVIAYARNDHLDFTIPYEWQGARHEYRPDYIIRWRCEDGREIKVILEVKGFETEQDRQKEIAARRWVRAVNHHGDFGQWAFVVCKEPMRIRSQILEALHPFCP